MAECTRSISVVWVLEHHGGWHLFLLMTSDVGTPWAQALALLLSSSTHSLGDLTQVVAGNAIYTS